MPSFPAVCAVSISVATSCIASAQTPPGLPSEPHIVVVGSGWVRAEPDYLEISFHVTLVRQDGPSAKAIVDENSTSVLRAIHDLGIAREQVTTSPLTLDIEYDYAKERPVVLGYKASRSIKLTLLDIGKFDEVVAKVTEAGATSISTPRLRSRREAELNHQAQERAIHNARVTADSLARGFGRELGAVYGIATREARNRNWGQVGGIFGDPSDGTFQWLTFDPGPISFGQTVYAVFLLGPEVVPAGE